MKSVLRKVLRIIGYAFAALLLLLLLWAAAHQALSLAEAKGAERVGAPVDVRGRSMNVYSLGDGDVTVVLMPGLGTAAPVLDFEPLAERLSADFRVVIAEPFGYGWSELTDEERSARSMVEELREALSAAGESGPYVLMPHSVSGIYAAWYADNYPDEVSAIVGIDCTLPRQVEYFGGAYPSVPGVAKLASPMGLCRLLCLLSPNSFISGNEQGIYSDANLRMQKELASRKGYSRNVIDEMNAIAGNVAATEDIEFSGDLPLLFFTRPEASHAARDDGKTSRSFYETYISNADRQRIVELESGHYMHWTQSDAIAAAFKDFVADMRIS